MSATPNSAESSEQQPEKTTHFTVMGHDYTMTCTDSMQVAVFITHAVDTVRLRGRKCPSDLVLLNSTNGIVPVTRLMRDLEGGGTRTHPFVLVRRSPLYLPDSVWERVGYDGPEKINRN